MTNIVYINPDDTELKNAIMLVEIAKKTYERADKSWDRSESSFYAYTNRYDAYVAAKKAYESVLINLALIFMERL